MVPQSGRGAVSVSHKTCGTRGDRTGAMKPRAVTTPAAHNAWQFCIFTAPDRLPVAATGCAKAVTWADCYTRTAKYSLMQINDSFDVVPETPTESAGT
jgi:hypothetical protein